MRKLWILFVLAQCVVFTSAYVSYAQETIQVEMLNRLEKQKMLFNPTIVEVSMGDTVNWIAKSKGHNVEFVASPQDIKFKSKVSRDTEYTFSESGFYLYVCTPHKGMGMIGLVVVGNDLSNIDDIASAKAIGKSKKKLKNLLASLK